MVQKRKEVKRRKPANQIKTELIGVFVTKKMLRWLDTYRGSSSRPEAIRELIQEKIEAQG